MLLRWCLFILANITFAVCTAEAFNSDSSSDSSSEEEEPKKTLPLFFSNRPRIISIFSKPPNEDAPKQTGPSIWGHVGNVIHGGSIGIEFRPLAHVQGILGHAKKILPGGKPEVGQPEHQTPPPEPHEPPKDDEDNEDEKDWVPENPKKPVPEGPSWEDIGEDPEDDPSIPYEEIINPRVRPRPKRDYLNSRIYHVPVKFVSNAKPFQLRFGNIKKLPVADKAVNSVLRK